MAETYGGIDREFWRNVKRRKSAATAILLTVSLVLCRSTILTFLLLPDLQRRNTVTTSIFNRLKDTPLLKIFSCITFNCFSVSISYTVDSSGLAVST